MPSRSGPIRAIAFGMVAPAGTSLVHLQAICSELSAGGEWLVMPHVAPSYLALVDAVRSSRVHLAWAPPVVALRIENERAGIAALTPARSARSEYYGALFVRQDSPTATLEALARSRAAWVDPESSAGYLVPRLHLSATGIDVEHFFASERFMRSHAKVARAVLRGEADVGATYATSDAGAIVDAGWMRAGARNEDVRILALAGPIPSDVIVVANLPRDVANDITARLCQLRSVSVRSLFGADQLEHAPSRHLEPLRRLGVRP